MYANGPSGREFYESTARKAAPGDSVCKYKDRLNTTMDIKTGLHLGNKISTSKRVPRICLQRGVFGLTFGGPFLRLVGVEGPLIDTGDL